MRPFPTLLLGLIILAPFAASAQPAKPTEADAVMAPIRDLFDGMRAADSSAVRAAFHPKASLFTVGTNREGTMGVFETPIDGFAAAVAGDHPVYDERLGDADVRTDGDLATVWVPYAFYVGDDFSHCGTNAFQLARLDGAWSIIHVTDTRRPDNCAPSIKD